MKNIFFSSAPINLDGALLMMRIGLGLIFIGHGYPKLIGGMQTWHMLGGAMANFGITFAPAFWGFAAACAEFFGGICLLLGFGMRIILIFINFLLVIALGYHLHNGDSYQIYSHPLSLLAVFCSLWFMGAGRYSVDYMMQNK